MWKLTLLLALLSFAIGCSVQNTGLQQRWPGSNGAPHNVHAITTEILPSTPAANSLQFQMPEKNPERVRRLQQPGAPGVGQGNDKDPRIYGTTSGALG